MKKILIISAVFILCFQFVCSASDLSQHLLNRAVNVIESEDSIDIYARISFSGNEKDDFVPNTTVTYSEAFMLGVQYVWSGMYDGKPVYVHLEEVDASAYVSRIRVIFDSVKNSFSFPYARKHSSVIWMYTGDGRSGIDNVYNYSELLYVSGHEFGHAALGLADAYADPNEQIKKYLRSPMNDWEYRQATDADYYIMLKHRTWTLGDMFVYSRDKELLKRYLQT